MARSLRRTLPVRLPLVAVLAVCAVLGASCSDDDDDDPSGSGATTTTGGQLLQASPAYCERATAFAQSVATSDETNGQTVIAGLEKSAVEARAMAKEAPEDQKGSHETLAAAAEEVVAALKAKNPQTLADFKAAEGEVVPAVREAHPDIDTATSQVRLLAQSACDVTIGES